MATNKNIQEPEVNVGEALSKTEKFFDTYKNHIIYGSAAIVAVAPEPGFEFTAIYIPSMTVSKWVVSINV